MEQVFAETDNVFQWVSGHSPIWIYLFVLISMLIENFFPPYPGDTLVFVCGVYAAGGGASWLTVYFLSVIGTLLSVMALFYIGRGKGRGILLHPRMKWLGVKKLDRIERWFSRWGEKLLIFSRYITGLRALMALFAGIGRVSARKMFFYSLISILTWNFIILYLALVIRRDWHKFDYILSTYNWIVSIIVAAILIVITGWYLKRRRNPQ